MLNGQNRLIVNTAFCVWAVPIIGLPYTDFTVYCDVLIFGGNSLRLTYIYLSYFLLPKFSFPPFSLQSFKIWYMNLYWRNGDQFWLLSCLTYFLVWLTFTYVISVKTLLKYSFRNFFPLFFKILTWQLVYEFVLQLYKSDRTFASYDIFLQEI